jgi:hypothetical protein
VTTGFLELKPGAAPAGSSPQLDIDREEKLRALGYIE